MHMADALLSPAVGGTMWVATAATTVYCSAKVRQSLDDRKVPLMGVLAAFVFAAQMINFTIPGTGSSGHLGGGLILAVLLGAPAAFLAIASVLTVQALFFADGGLLALGCNIFNLGIFPCFIAYPLIYKKIVGNQPTQGRLLAGSLIAAVFGLQLGALAVVMETTLSGVSELPFSSFVLMMQPIHLAIGIVEGLVTAGVISFIWKARPEILERAAGDQPLGALSVGRILIGLGLVTVLTGGVLSWYASGHPDGLEWSMFKVSGQEELEAPDGVHRSLEEVQTKTAMMPDYGFKASEAGAGEPAGESGKLGTTVAGLLGGLLVMLLGMGIGFIFKRRAVSHPHPHQHPHA
ncbi:MAG: energy-coupling factor ABC transporter permease [Proteobacteria bacterium]|nr:energy-coupling factor ABC transporter permease [Pseudomonadota bacterium]MBU1687186.1 energy-coupling factor ABC transporter permease [Pseudomonadota bacterium]